MITQKTLEDLNEWWTTGRVREELKQKYKRHLFQRLAQKLKARFINAITGLRRVGKTTLLYQLIDDLLESHTNPNNILYFSFDEAAGSVDEVLDFYREARGVDFKTERIFIFLDEIQKAENWENELKKYYDLYPKIKFVISGSESLFILGKTRETLAGRIFEFYLPPLGFREYLEFNGIENPETLSIRETEQLFLKYVKRGGFPETIAMEEREIGRYIRTIVVDKVIYRDIQMLGKIKDPTILVDLLETISVNPGMLVEYQSMAQRFERDKRTISKFIFWLRESFLIRMLGNYRKGRVAALRKAKKAYPMDNSFFLAFGAPSEPTFLGRAVETAVLNSAGAETFWKNTFDVDAVVDGVPLEVRYQQKITSQDLKGVRAFMKKFRAKEGIIVTKDERRRIKVDEGTIRLIPAWSYLLECGSQR